MKNYPSIPQPACFAFSGLLFVFGKELKARILYMAFLSIPIIIPATGNAQASIWEGIYNDNWSDPDNWQNDHVASGLYFIRIRNNGIVSTQKLQINRD